MPNDPVVSIVDDIQAVTPEWITAVLGQCGIDSDVATLSKAPVGTGQMSSTYRVFLEYKRGSGPESVIVKLPSGDAASRHHGRLGYRCETGFYRDFASKVSVRIPSCYFAASAEDGSAFTLVLEDVGPAEPGNQITGCTVEQAAAAAVNVAGLHAPTWCDPYLHDLDWVIGGGPDSAEFMAAILVDATTQFTERYTISDDTADVLRQFAAGLVGWVSQRRVPFSLVHGDYRLDNLMFGTAGSDDPVIALDWQVVAVGMPLRDVGFLLATGLLTDDRREAERRIVTGYHDALVALGVTGYGADACWDDYRLGLFQAPLITVLGALVAQPTERGDRMFTTMAERAATAIRDLDALALL